MSSSRCSASVLALLLIAGAAHAAPGLDLAILVDRSSSMVGRSAFQDVLLQMTVDLLARSAEASRAEHRIAVIGFGSAATVDVPLTLIRRDQPALRSRLAALHYEDRGETDVLAALRLAEGLFRQLPQLPDRRRAIVLLTDGVPFVHGIPSWRSHMQLRAFIEKDLAKENISLDVLLLDGRNAGFWAGLAHVTLAESVAERLLPQAHALIGRLAGTRTAEGTPSKSDAATEMLVVPPYLEMIVFDVVRGSAGSAVAIVPPGATQPIDGRSAGVTEVAVGTVLTTFAVPHPAAGEWLIKKSDSAARVRVLSQQFFPRGTLLHPAAGDRAAPCDRVAVTYRLLDGRGKPLRELPEYALSLHLALATPHGATRSIPMQRDPLLGAGGFRSMTDAACDHAGRYWTEVRVTAVDAHGRRLEVFRDRWSGFSVAPPDCAQRPR